MNQKIQFDYTQVSQLVDDYQLDISASQLHGIITASACTAGMNTADNNYLNLIAPYDSLNENQLSHLSDSLTIYHNQMLKILDSQMFEFELALPDDDSSSEFRTAELAAWCRGFLTAYRLQVNNDEILSTDAAEALQDLTEIAFAVTGDGNEEEFQQALAELEEYLRIGVQMIFDELNPTHTIH